MTSGWDLIKPNGLFTTQEMRDAQTIGDLRQIPIAEIIPFKNHTFKVREDADMEELKASIKENGVQEPIIVFKNEEDQLEIVSGHRRKRACELLGIEKIPALIKELTRDQAIVLMGESNLNRRTEILPSEKAFTYKTMLDALNRQGKRSDLTSYPGDTKLKRSDSELAKRVFESQATIHRYIRLTFLIPELLEVCDIGKMGIKPGVEISYLSKELQKEVYEFYLSDSITPSHAQAIQMHKLFKENLLDIKTVASIMCEEKPNQKEKISISADWNKRFFQDCKTTSDIEKKIFQALMLLEKQENIVGKKSDEQLEGQMDFDDYGI